MKKTRRSNTKYKNLNPNMNTKGRKDCLEGYNYINGVKNKDGELVIRPLNEEEKEWLDKFYAETIITDFYHTPELKRMKYELTSKELEVGKNVKSEAVITLENEILSTTDVELKSKLNKKLTRMYKNVGKKQTTVELAKLRNNLMSLQKNTLLYPDKSDQKKIYNENNTRNICLYNYTKKQGNLIGIDLNETDRYSSEAETSIDPENQIIDKEIFETIRQLEQS